MAVTKEKRTKPCLNCKKSKVKCIYSDLLPCERCMKTGQSSSCQFVPKLPSLKFDANMTIQTALPQLPPLQTSYNPAQLTHMGTVVPLQLHQTVITPRQQQISLPQAPIFPPLHLSSTGPAQHQTTDQTSPDSWRNTMEKQMSGFGDKLNDLTMLLRLNQAMLQQQQDRQLAIEDYTLQAMRKSEAAQRASIPWNVISSHSSSDSDDQVPRKRELFSRSRPKRKRIENSSYERFTGKESTRPLSHSAVALPTDFRDGFLLLEEAQTLFDFFNSKISQQLFGFDVSKISVPETWKTSPILICAICYISSIHYPGSEISRKLDSLRDYLHGLCREVLFKGRPKNEQEGFNTIMALIMCSFWLADLQMFTGLALQVAKEVGLNKVPSNDTNVSSPGGMRFQDKMKLWYLLYVLDGQQSITFNRQPLVDSQDYSLKNARGILGESKPKEIHSKSQVDANLDRKDNQLERHSSHTDTISASNPERETKLTSSSKEIIPENTYTASYDDMRLVSQVEYNQAIHEALTGNAWELLAPASFGIPSKSNLELDKWMVSWTVLLAPVTNGAVWSSKSTLIYYNFAKMHINSSAIRSLQFVASDSNSPLPRWDELLTHKSKQGDSFSPDKNEHKDNDYDEDDDDDDDGVEFISNQGLISTDQREVNTKIATGAAKTVLNLVLNDRDIMDNLKYVPVHIHIMLYYAALLLINPKIPFKTDNWGDAEFKSIISDLWTVKKLQRNITLNLPTDKRFGYRLISTLDQLLEDRGRLLKEQVVISKESNLITQEEMSTLWDMIQEVINHEISDSAIDSVETDLQKGSRGTTPPIPEKVYAWPGSNHGHP